MYKILQLQAFLLFLINIADPGLSVQENSEGKGKLRNVCLTNTP
jgi:hypothetical protein